MEDMLDMNNEIQEAMSRQYDTPDVSISDFLVFMRDLMFFTVYMYI